MFPLAEVWLRKKKIKLQRRRRSWDLLYWHRFSEFACVHRYLIVPKDEIGWAHSADQRSSVRPEPHMKCMTCSSVCWCILTASKNNSTLVTDCLSSHIWRKLVKFGLEAFSEEHMKGQAWVWYADISWPTPEMIPFWSRSCDFLQLVRCRLSEKDQIWYHRAFC